MSSRRASVGADRASLQGIVTASGDARSGRPSPLKVTELYVLSLYNGRTTVRPYKGLHVSHEHSNLLTIVLIPLYVRVPKTIPLLELFSSNGGTL